VRQFHYSFRDVSLLTAALTHRSKHVLNNERLEFLGDSILGFVIADELFRRFPKASEGELSRSRARLVKGDTLAKLARSLALGDYLQLGPGELKSGGYRRNSILADAFEALIGAIFVDGGLEQASAFIMRNYSSLLETLSIEEDAAKDPKTCLQEYLQGRKMALPEYDVTATAGSAHQQTFTVACRVEKYGVETEGVGNSRRKAEQASAEAALKLLKEKDNARKKRRS
jgi:ribonuclease-3